MANPISFPSTTTNLDFPLLFSGQAQKEFFINQSLATIDALLPKAVEGTLDDPPSSASDGECYRIGSAPTGEWSAHSDKIAVRVGGGWHIVTPTDGVEVFDRSQGQKLIYNSQWYQPATPAPPASGAVIDAEVRASLAQLVVELQAAGILSSSD